MCLIEFSYPLCERNHCRFLFAFAQAVTCSNFPVGLGAQKRPPQPIKLISKPFLGGRVVGVFSWGGKPTRILQVTCVLLMFILFLLRRRALPTGRTTATTQFRSDLWSTMLAWLCSFWPIGQSMSWTVAPNLKMWIRESPFHHTTVVGYLGEACT